MAILKYQNGATSCRRARLTAPRNNFSNITAKPPELGSHLSILAKAILHHNY